jgi:hypothetical protein
MEQDIKFVQSVIEDLAFPIRPSRESDKIGRCCCIEHDYAEALEMWASAGKEAGVE